MPELPTTYEVRPWGQALSTLADEWGALIDIGGYNPSLHPAWIEAVASSRGHIDRLEVFCARDGERLLGVIPFYRSVTYTLGIPLRTLDLAGNLLAYHHEAVILKGHHQQVLQAFLDHASIAPWDIFRCTAILAQSATSASIRDLPRRLYSHLIIQPGDASPWLPCDRGWAEFLSSRHRKFRYNLKRRWADFESRSGARVAWFEGESDVRPLLDAILEVEKNSWKAGQGLAISDRPHELAFHERLLPLLASRGTLLANVLFDHDRPVAYTLCCRSKGWIGELKTSFDEAYKSSSPGSIVASLMVRRAFETGAREYDFLGSAQPHKLAWTDRVRDHESLFVFSRRARARCIASLKGSAAAAKRSLRPRPTRPDAI